MERFWKYSLEWTMMMVMRCKWCHWMKLVRSVGKKALVNTDIHLLTHASLDWNKQASETTPIVLECERYNLSVYGDVCLYKRNFYRFQQRENHENVIVESWKASIQRNSIAFNSLLLTTQLMCERAVFDLIPFSYQSYTIHTRTVQSNLQSTLKNIHTLMNTHTTAYMKNTQQSNAKSINCQWSVNTQFTNYFIVFPTKTSSILALKAIGDEIDNILWCVFQRKSQKIHPTACLKTKLIFHVFFHF